MFSTAIIFTACFVPTYWLMRVYEKHRGRQRRLERRDREARYRRVQGLADQLKREQEYWAEQANKWVFVDDAYVGVADTEMASIYRRLYRDGMSFLEFIQAIRDDRAFIEKNYHRAVMWSPDVKHELAQRDRFNHGLTELINKARFHFPRQSCTEEDLQHCIERINSWFISDEKWAAWVIGLPYSGRGR
jgi:hypothetical protein